MAASSTPPHSSEVTIFIAHGVDVSAVLTRTPWEIDADTVVIPAGRRGELDGRFALSIANHLASSWTSILAQIRLAMEGRGFSPTKPIVIDEIELSENPSLKRLLIATAFGSNGATVETAVRYAIVQAKIHETKTLLLPLIGTGSGQLNIGDAVDSILQGIRSETSSSPAMRRIVLVTDDERAFELLSAATSSGNVRPIAALLEDLVRRPIDSNVAAFLATAERLALGLSNRPSVLTTRLMLFALMEVDVSEQTVPQSGAFHLLRRAFRNQEDHYAQIRNEYFSERGKSKPAVGSGLHSISENARSLWSAAGQRAQDEMAAQLSLEHVAHAFLSMETGRATGTFKKAQVDRVALLAKIEGDTSVGEPAPPGAHPSTLYVSPLHTDDPSGTRVDLLGVTEEVDAFTHLIASVETRLPLAIGIFGEWGSGKIFLHEKHDAKR